MKSPRILVIAVDGYSSCGKSTYARLIARELGFLYIDSGAMYRAVALFALRNGFVEDGIIRKENLIRSLKDIKISFSNSAINGTQETWLNGENVEQEIRGVEVSGIVSKISQIQEVREKMVRLQRDMGSKGGVVMDGRDIGSTVFPDAILKIFMKANAGVRAERRYKELIEKGIEVEYDDVLSNIRMRDHEDENRDVSPLRKASDALILDNSNMTISDQMKWFRDIWKNITVSYDR